VALATVPGAEVRAAEGLSPIQTTRIDTAVTAVIDRHHIPGLSIAIVAEGELRWQQAYGLADVENSVPARTTTVYRIASVSKPVTAVAAMQLAERGKLDLDAPVHKYAPALVVILTNLEGGGRLGLGALADDIAEIVLP